MSGRKRYRSSERDNSREREERFLWRYVPDVLLWLKNISPLEAKKADDIFDFARDLESRGMKLANNRDDKELFVGNVVDREASDKKVCMLFNIAMRQLGLVEGPGDPVTQCRKSSNYCFLDFRSSLECSLALNLNGIPFRDSLLRIRRAAEYPGPKDAIYNWEDLMRRPKRLERRSPVVERRVSEAPKLAPMPAEVPMPEQMPLSLPPQKPPLAQLTVTAPHPATRVLREIWVGSLGEQMTEDSLRHFLGGALMKMGLSNSRNEHPIVSVALKDSYAFLETRTCIDAANLLNLNYIPFGGRFLSIQRSKKFDGGCGEETYFKWDILLNMWLSGDLRLMTAGPPSRVIVATNVTTAEALAADANLYLDIIEDTRLECSQFGVVRSVIVPRGTSALNTGGSRARGRVLRAVGNVFVELDSVVETILTLLSLKVHFMCALLMVSYQYLHATMQPRFFATAGSQLQRSHRGREILSGGRLPEHELLPALPLPGHHRLVRCHPAGPHLHSRRAGQGRNGGGSLGKGSVPVRQKGFGRVAT